MNRIDPASPDVHLNLNVRGLKPSSTLAINERSKELQATGREVFFLGLGQSPFPVPPLVVDALRAHAHQKDYLAVKGLAQLRSAVAAYHRGAQRVAATPEDVLIGPGSKELMFILQLVYYGDLVIPTPSWVSYAPQASIIGRQVRWLRTAEQDGWRLTPDVLEDLCRRDPDRPRLLILNYPSNPTGRSYRADALQRLAAVARRYRVVVLSDEIYGELHHRGEHVSIAWFYPEGTIVSSGLSKWCGAGGWRLGTFTFPPGLRWLLEAMAVVASETFTSTSAPIQHAAVTAFEGGLEIQLYLRQARRILAAIADVMCELLEASGIDVQRPEGGFYLFPSFEPHRERLASRGIHDSETLCERLLEETGVALLPGSDFGRPEGELTARLAYVDFDGARAMSAATDTPEPKPLSEAFVRNQAHNLVEACGRIGDWVMRKSDRLEVIRHG